jgi:predicted transcriptional regulator
MAYREKKERRPARSQQYQHLMTESAFSNEMMETFSNGESIYSRLNPFEYNEELLDLEDQLKIEFWRVVRTGLTQKQCAVMELTRDGYTQMEIAGQLGIGQASVTKNLFGNLSYLPKNISSSDKRKCKSYGGTIKKMKRLVENDQKIQEILAKMNEIRSLKW